MISDRDLERGERQPLLSATKLAPVKNKLIPSPNDGAFQAVPNEIISCIISLLEPRDVVAFASTNTRLRTQTEEAVSYAEICRKLRTNKAQNQLIKIEKRQNNINASCSIPLCLALLAGAVSSILLIPGVLGEECNDPYYSADYKASCLEVDSTKKVWAKGIALGSLITCCVSCLSVCFFSVKNGKKIEVFQDQVNEDRNTVLNV